MTIETADDPLESIAHYIERARQLGEREPNAATLATVDSALHRPSARTVYAHVLPDGIGFFVNTYSGKGRQLLWNPHAALCFFWRRLEEQIVVEGSTELLDSETADQLWQKRSRESALIAHATQPGTDPHSTAGLAERVALARREHGFERPSRPEHWKGYRLRPDRFEFWTTGWDRARDRHVYERHSDSGWVISRQPP